MGVSAMDRYYLGFDIGGTKCAALLGKRLPDGFEILRRVQIPTLAEKGPRQTIDRLFAAAEGIFAEFPHCRPAAAGVSCGGPLNSQKGLVLSPPNLPGWDSVPITKLVSERFGIPAYLQNDANACALAEWLFGAGKGCRDMVFLPFGTGLGAGLILNGRLYDGASGMAGEAGHLRLSRFGPVGYGKAGSFEGFCSGGGIAQLGRTVITEQLQMGIRTPLSEKLDSLTTRDIADAARAGDGTAMEIIRTSARYLGRGLAVLVDLLNPSRIVLGSIFVRCEDLFREEMEKTLRQEALACSVEECAVVPAGLGEKIGDYAALCVAFNGPRD
mgnify:CR=1 FL=1